MILAAETKRPNILFAFADDWGRYASSYAKIDGAGTLNDNIFFDQNPPAKAVAEDGRIHFVFALNASVWFGRDENGRMQPGAHWVFGAGLL